MYQSSLMVNNSPVSLLAEFLDFSLNSLACLAQELGFTNPSCTELALGPRQLRHPESPVVAITQNYSYSIDTEQNGKMISTLLRGNSCSILLLEDDRFPFLSSFQSVLSLYSFLSIFVSVLSFSFTSFLFVDFLFLWVLIWASLSLCFRYFPVSSHHHACKHKQYIHSYTQGNPTLKIHSQEY